MRDILTEKSGKWERGQQFQGDKGTWLPYFPGPIIEPFRGLHKPTLRFRERAREAIGKPLYFVYRNYLYYAEQLSAADITIPPGSGDFTTGYNPLPPDDDIHSDFLPPKAGFPFLRFGKVRHVTIGQNGDNVECHAAAVSGTVLYFCGDQKHLYRCNLSKDIVVEATVIEIEGYFNNYLDPDNKRCIRLFPIVGGLVAVERYRVQSTERPNGRVPHETILTPEAKGSDQIPSAVLAWQTYWWDVDAYQIQCTEQQEFLSVYAVAGSGISFVNSLGELGANIKEVKLEGGSSAGENITSNYAQTLYPAVEGNVSVGSGAQLIGESADFKLSVYSSMILHGGFVLQNCDGVGKVLQEGAETYEHIGFYKIEDNYGDAVSPGYSMTDIANLVQVI